jgi:hypothetical protein
VTFSVGKLGHGRSWYPYLRGNGALSLHIGTSPAEGDDVGLGIELIAADETPAAMVNDILSSSALQVISSKRAGFPRPGTRVLELRVIKNAELHKPNSLSGELVDPGQGLRAYVFAGHGQTLAAVVVADRRSELPSFLPEAAEVLHTLSG